MLALTSLYADSDNPRNEVPRAELNELTDDIRQRGVPHPIVFNASDEDGRYRIQFGSKRWRAAEQAGFDEVPIIFATRAHDIYDKTAENLKRHWKQRLVEQHLLGLLGRGFEHQVGTALALQARGSVDQLPLGQRRAQVEGGR